MLFICRQWGIHGLFEYLHCFKKPSACREPVAMGIEWFGLKSAALGPQTRSWRFFFNASQALHHI